MLHLNIEIREVYKSCKIVKGSRKLRNAKYNLKKILKYTSNNCKGNNLGFRNRGLIQSI